MEFKTSEKSGQKIEQFADMGLEPILLTCLDKMKISKPTSVQSESIGLTLKGEDLIGVAQTGSGKTLAYALPTLTRLLQKPDSRALVLTTSQETADQVFRVFTSLIEDLSVSHCLVTAGQPGAKQDSQLKKVPRLIVATPGRLSDHLNRNKLLLKGLEILVIDEADRMLDLGFEPQLQFIQSTLRGARQTLMFAATFSPKAEAIAKIFMTQEPYMIRSAAAETPVSTLAQRVLFLTAAQKNNRLVDELAKIKGSVLIFTESKESCVAVGRFLTDRGLSCDFVHGDMNPGHRNRVVREFREKQIQVMIATDLHSRGLDIPHIDTIINFDLPYKAEDFLHRIGRTARAEREGNAITFITPADGRSYRKIKNYLQGASEETLASSFAFVDRRPASR